MNIQPIKIGSYINFTVQRVEIESSGIRKYIQDKFCGRVVYVDNSSRIEKYRIKVRNKQEYHIVPRYKVTHVWYTK